MGSMPTSAKLEDQQLRFYPSARCGVRDHPKLGIILNSEVCFRARFGGHSPLRGGFCSSLIGIKLFANYFQFNPLEQNIALPI
jgi:hypothetical protein